MTKAATMTKTKPTAKPKGAVVLHHPAAPPQPKSLLQVCAEAAKDKAVDPTKMQMMLQMLREEEARAAEREFNEALSLAQQQTPIVVRDAVNPHTKSKYARLESVSKAINPILRNHGFSLSYGMADSPLDNHYRITARLSLGAHSREFFIDLPADTAGAKGTANKSATQGVGSTISYGRRYLKLMIFDITVAGEDTDGTGGTPTGLNERQIAQLKKALAEGGPDETKFCGAFSIEKIEDLPLDRFKEALDRVASYKEASKP